MTKEEFNKLIELFEKAKEESLITIYDKNEDYYYIDHVFEDSGQFLIKIKPE